MGKLSGIHPKYGIRLVKSIQEKFGTNFLILNGTTFFSYVGIIYYLIQGIQLPYYQSAGLDSQLQSEMAAISRIPWNCKGLIGTIADILPLFGRQKFYHVLFYMFLGIIACIILAFLPFEIVGNTPIVGALAFFAFNLSSAASDLLLESKYIQIMQTHPQINADILSFAWFCETFGQLFPSIFVGIIADHMDVRINFYIFFPFLLIPLPFLFKGGLIDDYIPWSQCNKINMERIRPQIKLVTITTLHVVSSIILIIITPIYGSTVQSIYVLCSFLVLITITYVFMDRVIANFALYTFLMNCFYVNIQGALEYYYTADPDCVPNGPNFSYTIVNTLAPIAFTIGQFAAIIIFQVVFCDWEFRYVFMITSIIATLGSISDLILVNGWNRYVYIPDEVVFIFGYATFSQIFKIISSITTSYMISKLSPKGFEATMFSLLAGYSHFGVTASYFFGVYLMDLFKIQSIIVEEENIGCDYSNLNWLIIVSHFILPMIQLPTVFLLIPKLKLNERIDNDYVFADRKNKKKELEAVQDVTI